MLGEVNSGTGLHDPQCPVVLDTNGAVGPQCPRSSDGMPKAQAEQNVFALSDKG